MKKVDISMMHSNEDNDCLKNPKIRPVCFDCKLMQLTEETEDMPGGGQQAHRSELKNKIKMKKYELTSEKKVFGDIELHRIKALKAFRNVKEGDLGGWIESEKNLSQRGNAWISENAMVSGNATVCEIATVSGNAWVGGTAKVSGFARVGGNAKVNGYATVCENAIVYGSARISGNATVGGNAWVGENAMVCENADYIVFKNWWSSGRYFTWTRSNNKWTVGCFFGTGDELVAKAYKDSEKSGREYERVVRYVESILKEEDNDNGNRNKREG